MGGNRSLQAGRSSGPSAAPSPTKDAGRSGSTSAPHMSATKVSIQFQIGKKYLDSHKLVCPFSVRRPDPPRGFGQVRLGAHRHGELPGEDGHEPEKHTLSRTHKKNIKITNSNSLRRLPGPGKAGDVLREAEGRRRPRAVRGRGGGGRVRRHGQQVGAAEGWRHTCARGGKGGIPLG